LLKRFNLLGERRRSDIGPNTEGDGIDFQWRAEISGRRQTNGTALPERRERISGLSPPSNGPSEDRNRRQRG
jgi:hypothetical protein